MSVESQAVIASDVRHLTYKYSASVYFKDIPYRYLNERVKKLGKTVIISCTLLVYYKWYLW